MFNFIAKFLCMTPIFYIIIVYNIYFICSTYSLKNITTCEEFIYIYVANLAIIAIVTIIIVCSHIFIGKKLLIGEEKTNKIEALCGKKLNRATQDNSLAFYTSILSIVFLTQPIDLWGFLFAIILIIFIVRFIEFRTIFISNKILYTRLQVFEYEGYLFIMKNKKYKQKIEFSYEEYKLIKTDLLKSNGIFVIEERNGK